VQPRGLTEDVEYFFDRPCLLHDRPDEQDHVIGIHAALVLDFLWFHPPQYTIVGCLLEHAVENVHCDDEEQQGQRVSLPDSPEVPDRRPLMAVE
jgi:hypothetical protein